LSHNVNEQSGNDSLPFHFIQGFTHTCPQHELSSKSLETKYSLEPQTSILIVNLEIEGFCECSGSDSVDWQRNVIIFHSFDLESDVEILDV